MTDPLSAVAAVIGIAGFALHSARRLKEFFDGLKGAPRAVIALAKDVHALCDVIQPLNDLLNDDDIKRNSAQAQFISRLQPLLNNCITIAIKPFTKLSGDARTSKWRGAFFWSFREKEILGLQRDLVSYKMTLEIAISSLSLAISTSNFRDVKKQIYSLRQRLDEERESVANSSFQGSDVAMTDYGFAMRRYLLETESVLSDSLPESPTFAPAQLSPDSLVTPMRTQSQFVPWAAEVRSQWGSRTEVPDIVVGIDFGLTCTGVAYSAGPHWFGPRIIDRWRGKLSAEVANKVPTAIAYHEPTGNLATWGFLVDEDDYNSRIEELFKLYMVPQYRDSFRDAPTIEEAGQWFRDYLTCLYAAIDQFFTHSFPQWRTSNIEFCFPVPTTWRNLLTFARVQKLIEEAGFGV